MNTPQRQNGANCVHPGESGRPLLSPDLGGCQEDEAGPLSAAQAVRERRFRGEN